LFKGFKKKEEIHVIITLVAFFEEKKKNQG